MKTDLQELFRSASPPCSVCAEPVERTETRWIRDEEGWRQLAVHICPNHHRTEVEP